MLVAKSSGSHLIVCVLRTDKLPVLLTFQLEKELQK
jgi:hypothetical protein